MNSNQVLQVLRVLESATPSARANALLHSEAPTSPEVLARLGWQAGRGIGLPPPNAYQIPGELTGRGLLEGAYWRAFILAEQESKPRKITKHGLADYTQSLRRPAYALWKGAISLAEFATTFIAALHRGLSRAWREGASEFGIAPDELNSQERMKLELAIAENLQYINPFGADIIAGKKGISKWAPFKDRINRVWANRYNQMRNQGALLAAANQKMEWVLHLRHFTKEPCKDCLNLNGRVYRRETWLKAQVFPQSRDLECQGFWCGCGFRPAPEARVNRGRPPKLTGQKR
ncbi:MAG: hypothetical protein KAT00_03355 [Planctomycetes bacterium]|nr:hypothetical protein [Planctomycetota bacterium]